MAISRQSSGKYHMPKLSNSTYLYCAFALVCKANSSSNFTAVVFLFYILVCTLFYSGFWSKLQFRFSRFFLCTSLWLFRKSIDYNRFFKISWVKTWTCLVHFNEPQCGGSHRGFSSSWYCTFFFLFFFSSEHFNMMCVGFLCLPNARHPQHTESWIAFEWISGRGISIQGNSTKVMHSREINVFVLFCFFVVCFSHCSKKKKK